jgi:hypothetical protein
MNRLEYFAQPSTGVWSHGNKTFVFPLVCSGKRVRGSNIAQRIGLAAINSPHRQFQGGAINPKISNHRSGVVSTRDVCATRPVQAINIRAMADYYPLIASVIAALENNSAELRRRLYESTRSGFLIQMRKHDPPLEESVITKEQIALEEAIRRVEAEQVSRLAKERDSDRRGLIDGTETTEEPKE